MIKIDFVVPWVDGNDPAWQKSFNKYLPESKKSDDTRIIRYRDWENLRYWFRGVEKFAPWVNKVHFITNGQIPDWLNLDAPKLHFVKHSDYIPKEYLPTFSANPIEINMHRIKGLAEHFVYFNDDLFLIDKVAPERFFKNGLPCDIAALNAISNGHTAHLMLNDLTIINSAFNKKKALLKHFWKWITPKAGSKLFRTFALSPWPNFTGFYQHHLPQSFLKSTFEEVWYKNEDILMQTTASRFRGTSDVNQWLFRYWQLVKGNFIPFDVNKDSVFFEITDSTVNNIVEVIQKQKKKIIVLNDGDISSFEEVKEHINTAFDKILPEKSSFEK